MDVLTTEIKARALQSAIAADVASNLDFSIPVGDAIVINGIEIQAVLGTAVIQAVAEGNGTLALCLTPDGVATDVPGISDTTTFDVNPLGGVGGILFFDYSFILNPMEATETGVTSFTAPPVAIWNWRSLDVMKRPITTEFMRVLINTMAVAVTVDFAITLSYQRIRLHKGDFGLLQPGARIIRFPDIPEGGFDGLVGRIQ